MNSLYKEQVRLLLRTLPVIYQEDNFAVHGGTAINLFINNLPRYSVDVDLTYIHSAPRKESLTEEDRLFLLSFEEGNPQWEHSVYSDLKEMPSVQWKLLNINKLKSLNPTKHKREVFKLKSFWGME